MPPTKDLQLPFITRKMLDFGESANFTLIIDTMSASSYTSSLNIQGMTKAGVFKYSCTIETGGALQTFSFKLPDIPIFLSIIEENPNIGPNNVWVIVKLGVNGDVGMILTQGYPSDRIGISWPIQQQVPALAENGANTLVTVAVPAAGAEWSVTIPANQKWEIRSIFFIFTASAVVASRRPGVEIKFPTNVYFSIPTVADVIISQAYTFNFYKGAISINDATGFRQTAPLPEKIIVGASIVINSLTTNIQAGDQYSEIRMEVAIFYI